MAAFRVGGCSVTKVPLVCLLQNGRLGLGEGSVCDLALAFRRCFFCMGPDLMICAMILPHLASPVVMDFTPKKHQILVGSKSVCNSASFYSLLSTTDTA